MCKKIILNGIYVLTYIYIYSPHIANDIHTNIIEDQQRNPKSSDEIKEMNYKRENIYKYYLFTNLLNYHRLTKGTNK